jgi:hypothetical protein
MGKVISLAAARKRKAKGDLPSAKSYGVKGGLVINWATTRSNRPGDERGVIAIVKPAGGG